ncbi:hypothetical protein BKA81DRAFT_10534 [Phyllosticta paracitricarpa]
MMGATDWRASSKQRTSELPEQQAIEPQNKLTRKKRKAKQRAGASCVHATSAQRRRRRKSKIGAKAKAKQQMHKCRSVGGGGIMLAKLLCGGGVGSVNRSVDGMVGWMREVRGSLSLLCSAADFDVERRTDRGSSLYPCMSIHANESSGSLVVGRAMLGR